MKQIIDNVRIIRRQLNDFVAMCHELHNNGPHWIEEWQEFAGLDAMDRLHYGETARDCAQRMDEANNYIARWWRDQRIYETDN
jgi:hypothetical protein